ncbi:MAG: arginine-tRNA-protein transferase [Acidobacteriota bacterium]
MLDAGFQFINEEFYAEKASPIRMDTLLENGWRHFGTHFFRYSIGYHGLEIRRVIPLRIRLADFSLSKSQRRIQNKNEDLRTVIRPIEITAEVESLFDRHKTRFDQGVPNSIYDFLSHEPAAVPCEAMEVSVFEGERLLAASFFDVGKIAISGIYAMFEPSENSRGLGIFTMLKEIEFAAHSRKEFYYQGYCYEGESFYDYKKRFRGTESFDWIGNWQAFN